MSMFSQLQQNYKAVLDASTMYLDATSSWYKVLVQVFFNILYLISFFLFLRKYIAYQ